MSAQTAIVLQARIGSTRLPGKVLATINAKPVLQHCIERLRLSGLPVIVATSTEKEDDVVADVAHGLGALIVRGPSDDVLERYAMAVIEFGLFEVVRATADNPAVDIDAAGRCLELLRRSGADHVVERGLPYGAAVEAVAASAILIAADQATASADREHVTPFIKRDSQFTAIDAIAPGVLRRPSLRLTVDTPEDLEYMRKVYGRLLDTTGQSSLLEIMRAADRLSLSEADGATAVRSTR